jgi:glycosyl transferase family 25
MKPLEKNNTLSAPDSLFRAYIINLENAPARWAETRLNLEALEIAYVRVEAIPGDLLPKKPEHYNRLQYNISHGKQTNRREIGCYLSHIKALQTFLGSGDEYGLILEDDIQLPANTKQLIHAAIPHAMHWDMIRLSAHTPGEPLPFAELPDGYVLAYNTKTLKNTGAYLVNRHAAQCICKKMLPMSLPYDVALDVEWRYGFKTAYISPLPMLINYNLPSQIPPARKIRLFRTTTFHLFHSVRHFQRRLHRRRWFNEVSRKIKNLPEHTV